MASYFRQLPNFEYVSRNDGEQYLSDYVPVKNLFKRGKIREYIFANLQFFEKYQIIGDERPDNVAYKVYDDESLDWVILLSNNILNIQSEWPMSQRTFDQVMLEKYDDYETLYSSIHHYESLEVINSSGLVIFPSGVEVNEDFFVEYNDDGTIVYARDITVPVTNYEYEVRLEEKKRNIYILKPQYLNIIFNDMEDIMQYKKGSQQYISETLKRGDNIRLYT
jgi:hypothetical protein